MLTTTILVSILAVEVLQLINNGIISRRNLIIYRNEIDSLREQLKQADKTIERLAEDNISDTAFAITAEGVKALPKDWIRLFEEPKGEVLTTKENEKEV